MLQSMSLWWQTGRFYLFSFPLFGLAFQLVNSCILKNVHYFSVRILFPVCFYAAKLSLRLWKKNAKLPFLIMDRNTGNVLTICTSATRVIKGRLIIAFLPFIQIERKPMNLRFSARKTKLDDWTECWVAQWEPVHVGG